MNIGHGVGELPMLLWLRWSPVSRDWGMSFYARSDSGPYGHASHLTIKRIYGVVTRARQGRDL